MSDTAKKKPLWLVVSALALFAAAAYFANVEIQGYLGEKARTATGLQMRTLEEASAIAMVERKPILVELSAVWCPACRHFDKTVLSDPGVQKRIDDSFVFAHLEYESEEGRAFMERHNVGGFPTTYILKPDGSLVRQLRTTMNPDEFTKQLVL